MLVHSGKIFVITSDCLFENTNVFIDVQIRLAFPPVKKFNGSFNKINILLVDSAKLIICKVEERILRLKFEKTNLIVAIRM